MSFKVFLFVGLLVALLLWYSSDVAATDLGETPTKTIDAKDVMEEVKGLNEEKYPGGGYGGYPGGGYGGYPGGGYGGYPGRGRGGYGRYPGRGGYGGGGYGRDYCRYGCCGWGYYGRNCRRCCSYAGEAVDKAPQIKPHN